MTKFTKESIVSLLAHNDRAVCRALVVLNDRQTVDEQASEHTRHHNGRGFRPCHARMGTSMAKQFARKGKLTDKQIAYWRKPMRDGNMRIGIYAGQLLEEAEKKEMQVVAAVKLPPAPVILSRDASYIDDMGTYLAKKSEYELSVDSDNVELVKPIVDELRRIEKKWNLPNYQILGSVYN